MLFRIFKAFTGPFIWHFEDPTTGQAFEALNRQTLLKLVIDYRKQNGLEEIEMLPVVVENYNCLRPENIHKCCDNPKITRRFFGYLQGGVALLKYYFMDKQVEDSVAEVRAAQCVKCPFNIFPDKGAFLSWSDEVAEAATGGRRSSVHEQLGSCSVCSCTLKAKIFQRGPFDIAADQRPMMEGVQCWQLKG